MNSKYVVTVSEAIEKGQKLIATPLLVIIVLSIVLPVILIFFLHTSWWFILLLPLGLMLYFLYGEWITLKWRLWAYEYVNDIHQFQRAAELEGLLMRQSYESIEHFMTSGQKEKLIRLQQRFLEEADFFDDISIPSEVIFYRNGQLPVFFNKPPLLVLNDKGIQFEELYVEWSDIINERIARIGHDEEYSVGRPIKTARSKELFRYETHTELYEIPLSEIPVPAWKLDYLLYIYRGRYTEKNTA